MDDHGVHPHLPEQHDIAGETGHGLVAAPSRRFEHLAQAPCARFQLVVALQQRQESLRGGGCQLVVAAQHPERRIELMGGAGGQLAENRHLLRLDQLRLHGVQFHEAQSMDLRVLLGRIHRGADLDLGELVARFLLRDLFAQHAGLVQVLDGIGQPALLLVEVGQGVVCGHSHRCQD